MKTLRIFLSVALTTTCTLATAQTTQQTDPELYAMMQRAYGVDVRNIGQLDLKTREMVSCVALTALGTTPQVAVHARAALDAGVTPIELREAIYLVAPLAGFPKVLNAMEAVNRVFAERDISLPLPDQSTTTPETRHQVGHDIQWKLYEGGIARAMSGLPGEMGQQMAILPKPWWPPSSTACLTSASLPPSTPCVSS